MGMKKSMLRRVISSAFLIILAMPISASGRSEDPIKTARELVANNRINAAILLLEQTVREDPERIVEAEALMRTIREIRGEYNVLFELLINNLVNNPDDIVRTLEIIDQMEQLDEFPNERVLNQVEDARIIAQLAYDRSIVEQTMDAARDRLALDDYAGAIDLYMSLGDLQRSAFEDRGYGEIFLNRVNEVVALIETVADDFLARVDPYAATSEAILVAARRDPTAVGVNLFEPFLEEATALNEILLRAEQSVRELTVLRSQVPLQFPDRPVEWYLNFHETMIRGRPDLRGEEGLVHAIQRLFGDAPEELVAIARERSMAAFEEGRVATGEGRHRQATAAFSAAAEAARFWEQSTAIAGRIFETGLPPEEIVDQVDTDLGGGVLEAQAILNSALSMTGVTEALDQASGILVEETAPVVQLRQRRAAVQPVVVDLFAGLDQWSATETTYQEIPSAYFPDNALEVIRYTTSRHEAALDQVINLERDLVVVVAARETETVPAVLAGVSGSLSGVQPLLEGVEEPIEDDETGDADAIRTVRYPDEALVRLDLAASQLDEARVIVDAAREEVSDSEEYLVTGPQVQRELTRLALLREQLDSLAERTAGTTIEAQALIAEAEDRRDTGFQRIADSRAAISAVQLDAARNNWNAARDAFFDSLELREDPEFREEADALIAAVGEELLELQNVIVVRRVRELLTQAESLYNQDEYVAARDTLLQAQETWEQTNVEPNSEIDRWLLLATAAISLEEGRELVATDPLYPVLGNYLSVAREDFARGMRLFEAGNTEQADRFFDRSIENLRNVRDVRPLNWDARILELRIVQTRDADEFEEIFATRYNQAVSRLDEVGPLEVYSELEVLAEINPDYPGIQDQLRRLEIALNLRPDPIDQQRIARSQQLFQQAQNLSTGSRDQAVVAVSLLQDAVDLNPGNSNARFLLDQLRIRLGGQATAALSTADEQQYRRAETLLQQGQVLQALSIAERLLSNPENQGYPPLVELRRRIGLRLGI
jgi:tetratricopeptide (TPR) repeat protein